MRPASRLGLLGAIASSLFAAACSSSSNGGASSESDALVINPVGHENESHVTLQLPTDACVPGATCAKPLGAAPSLFIDGAAVALGVDTRLHPGAHTLAVNNVGASFTTTPGQKATLVLPIVNRKCTNAALPNVPHTDFGGSVTVSNAACPTTATGSSAGVPVTSSPLYWYSACDYVAADPASSYYCPNAVASYTYSYRDATGACVLGGYGVAGCEVAQAAASSGTPGVAALTDAFEATAPGTLTATVGGASQSITLAFGNETDFALSLPAIGTVPATFETDVTFLDPRANSDAAVGTITSSCAGDASYAIPASTGATAPLSLHAFVSSGCTYTLNVAGRTVTLDQTTTNAISLNRLDVNDVTVTREDGTSYTTKGTYTLNYGGVQVAGPYSTGTGIDVLPGTYEFSLSYTDFDGLQTQTQTVTF